MRSISDMSSPVVSGKKITVNIRPASPGEGQRRSAQLTSSVTDADHNGELHERAHTLRGQATYLLQSSHRKCLRSIDPKTPARVGGHVSAAAVLILSMYRGFRLWFPLAFPATAAPALPNAALSPWQNALHDSGRRSSIIGTRRCLAGSRRGCAG
jgi:hypothetical protein